MKNLNDIFSGAVLLCLCAVGAYEVSASIAPSDGEVVGADALPTLALGGMALCGVFLILQGLLRSRPGRSWGNRSAVIKTLLFFGFFVMYLSGMIWLGDRLVEQSWFPWPHNGGFTISTFLFLLFSLPLLGRRNPVEIMGVAALTTGALLYAFGYFFQIMLPEDTMSEVFAGIEAALSFGSLIANVTGVSLGILFGAMPGLTAAMGVALLIPLSFGMPPVEAFSMLLGMYAGAIYGGSITAILVGTPGTVAAAATLLEGPKLTAKGQSRKALEMATFASFFGGIFSAVALVTCAPLLATAAMSFGPAEYFALAVFALTVVATLSSGAMCKGLAAAFVGLFLSTVGIDPVSGDFRNTFDVPELFNGISLVPALVGLFAVSQVLLSLEDVFLGKSGIVKEGKLSNQGLTLREIWTNKFNLLRSSLLGTLIGIIPATGASAATFIAYGEAKRFSKHPEAFGKGTLEGVAATESSNNGVTGGALIPLMTLGVPGDVLTAILLGALMIQGLTPGPLLFQEHGATVNGIFASFFVSNILILVVGLIAVRILGKVVLVPTAILMSIVLTLCAIGSFAANNSTFDIGVMAAFGLLGYLMLKAGFPQPPMLLAMILGPLAESNFRRALSLSRDDFSTFFTSPISCAILAVSACVVLKTIWDEYRGCKREAV